MINNNKMRIAFDVTQTGDGKAGCGYLAYSLIRALSEVDTQNEYLLMSSFGPDYFGKNISPSAIGIHNPRFTQGLHHLDYGTAKRFWNNSHTDLDAELGNPDIVHANNFYCPQGLKNARLLYTLYDLSFIDHPEWTTEANRWICFKGMFTASLYADGIVAISEFSRQHFLRTFPHYPANKTHLIYPASRYTKHDPLKKPSKIPARVRPDQFWLCVGTLEPRKNQLGLLEAYANHKAKMGNALPLVHAGGSGWMMENFNHQIISLGLQDDVILLGYVDETTLQWLYQNCFALIYPSLFEGFGLPVLEAMSLGTAVITSNTTSIPEIIGQAGILVNPLVNSQISDAMDQLMGNENQRQALKRAALKRSELFSWEKSAQETLDLYSILLN